MNRMCVVAVAGLAALAAPSLPAAPAAQPSKAEQGFDEKGRVVNLKRWFPTLPVRPNKEKAKGFEALYHFWITGSKGGHWWVRVKDQKAFVSTRAPKDKPTCDVRASDENWLKIINGELKAMTAYLTFRLRIGGSKDQAKRFDDLFF